MSDKLQELKVTFLDVISNQDPQERGYSLEKLLTELFALFDIDA